MKSFSTHVLAVYEALLQDASAHGLATLNSIEMDLSYLRRVIDQRGLSFFTLTLPALGKSLDRLLDGTSLKIEIPQGVPTIKGRPELFSGIFQHVIDVGGTRLAGNLPPDAVFFARQLCYLCKKLRLECSPRAYNTALSEFFQIEQQLPPPLKGTWDEDTPKWSPRLGHPLSGIQQHGELCLSASPVTLPDGRFIDFEALRLLCGRVVSQFGDFDHWELGCRHGPGAVSETVGFVSKYEFPHWPRKLDLVFPYDWFATFSLDRVEDSAFLYEEHPSRLIAVPKTQKSPRLICAEPIAHQWVQQGIWRALEGKVSHSPYLGSVITFRSQENSRERALRSSMDQSLATVDLSSASDRLSCRLVEFVFQSHSQLLDMLHASRTRYLSQTISADHPRMIKLKKFAPMGSACTFPVQSIVFALISIFGVLSSRGIERSYDEETLRSVCREVTVFGDDIIVPNDSVEVVKLLLQECGLKVNSDKTFSGDSFRESCGMDAYKGYDVTPAYLLEPYDGSPSAMATTIEVSNNFHKKGCWRAAEAVVSQFTPQEHKLLRVVAEADEGLGLYSFCGPYLEHLTVRWDKDLQREYRVALGLTSKVKKAQGTGRSGLVQYFTERPDPMLPWSSGQPGRALLRKGRVRVYV